MLALVCMDASSAQGLSNQLGGHTSPYLRLHAEDPVAWQDLGPATIGLARQENKLLYLSIGYFSCYWCHVMQRESYKDTEIAAVLNKHFVPVKVDRELQPALDAQMMDFVQATQGRGGWPLNVFITPGGDPLYAVLYMPPQQFLKVLSRLWVLWESDSVRLAEIAKREATESEGPGAPILDPVVVRGYSATAIAMARQTADPEYGGFGRQPKFPSVPQLEFLLARYADSDDLALQQMLRRTLDNMASNGLQDHLGGGFFRYTVDRDWKTPHFEKMLYDNALLARLYLRASEVLNIVEYREVALHTLDFMIEDMATPSGALIASFSAVDGDDVEGGFYLWNDEDLQAVLHPDEVPAAKLAWQLNGPKRIEGGYLPIRAMAARDIATRLGTSLEVVQRQLSSARRKLLRARRTQRVLPPDTKLLAGWNGLVLSSLAEASQVTGLQRYIDAADKVRVYLVDTLWDGTSLQRTVERGRPWGQPSVEDYAYVAQGLWAWAEFTGKEQDHALVRRIIAEAWRRFYAEEGWTLAEQSVIGVNSRRAVLEDGAMPSPSAIIAETSLKLAQRYQDEALRDRVLSALNRGHSVLRRAPLWFATHVEAMLLALDEARGVAAD